MAYKPKYAQTKSVPGKTEKVQPIPKQDASVQKQKKMGKGMLIFFIFLGLIVVPLSSFATVRLMGSVLQYVGRPKAAVPDDKWSDIRLYNRSPQGNGHP